MMVHPSASSGDGIYHVFLNFRGPDTRTGFTGHLYRALSQRGLLTFMDAYDLGKGEHIKQSLLNKIQKSRMAIVVFSKSYAYSSFCLTELVQIFDCFTKQNMSIWPVFYDVDRSEVKNQTGSYREAFAMHEQGRFKHEKDMLKKWRTTLCQIADMDGSQFKHGGELYEYEFISYITDKVYYKLKGPEFHDKGNMLRIHGMRIIDGGAFVGHEALILGESSKATGFAETKNIQAQSPTSSRGQVNGELCLGNCSTMLSIIIDTSLIQETEATQYEAEMDAFYACLDAETPPALSEAAREAWKTVEDFFSYDVSVLMHPEQCRVLKNSLEYLSKLSADDGMPTKMSMLIVEASRTFPHWSEDYLEASRKIESTASELHRAEELDESLKANLKQYKEVKAQQEQLLKMLARNNKRMTHIYEEGKIRKTGRDQLRAQVPHLQHELCSANQTQTRILTEWSQFRAKINAIAAEMYSNSNS